MNISKNEPSVSILCSWDPILSRVLKRNRTKGYMYVYISLERKREIYYKKLAHMITEAEKPDSLPSASWRPRNSGGLILKAWDPESWLYRFQSRSEGLRAKSRESKRLISKLTQEESKFNLPPPFCFIQALGGLGDAHPHWRGPPAVLCLPVQMLVFSANTVTDTPSYLGGPWPSQGEM